MKTEAPVQVCKCVTLWLVGTGNAPHANDVLAPEAQRRRKVIVDKDERPCGDWLLLVGSKSIRGQSEGNVTFI
jgi:hypothetical protein